MQTWKEHFKNLFGNSPKVKHKPITKIINRKLKIKLGQLTQDKFNEVLRKIQNRDAAGPDEILPKVCKTRKFDDLLVRFCNAVYKRNPIEVWTKGCILPSPTKDDLGIIKNYRVITLRCIAAKVYRALLRNVIKPEIGKILKKNRNGCRRKRSTISQILTICQIFEWVRVKILRQHDCL